MWTAQAGVHLDGNDVSPAPRQDLQIGNQPGDDEAPWGWELQAQLAQSLEPDPMIKDEYDSYGWATSHARLRLRGAGSISIVASPERTTGSRSGNSATNSKWPPIAST